MNVTTSLKFLEKHKLQKLTQEEIDNLKNPISIKEIKVVIKNFPTKKTTDPNGFSGEFYQTFKKKIPILI